MRKKQKQIKEKVEKELSKCLEDGCSEQEAIVNVRRNLAHSYSVKLVHRTDKNHGYLSNPTAFYKRLKNAQIAGTPRLIRRLR